MLVAHSLLPGGGYQVSSFSSLFFCFNMAMTGKRMSVDVSVLLDSSDQNKTWNAANIQWLSDMDSPNSFPRLYHSCISYQNHLLVYGGVNAE